MITEKNLGKDEKLKVVFMDFEKIYDDIDREASWNVLKTFSVGGQLMEGIIAFYRTVSACVKMDGVLNDSFAIGAGVRHGPIMSLWLFDIFMDGYIREMRAKVGRIGARLKLNGAYWSLVACLFADDTMLLAET